MAFGGLKKSRGLFFLFASSSLGWLACQRPCVGVASRRPILRRPLRFALPARASSFQSERAYGLPRLPTDVWLVAAAGGNTGMHCQATPSCFYVILGGNHAAGGGRLMRCQWMATIEHGRARLSALSPLWVRSYVRTYELRSCPCPPCIVVCEEQRRRWLVPWTCKARSFLGSCRYYCTTRTEAHS